MGDLNCESTVGDLNCENLLWVSLIVRFHCG